jgi:hypothetical protein
MCIFNWEAKFNRVDHESNTFPVNAWDARDFPDLKEQGCTGFPGVR